MRGKSPSDAAAIGSCPAIRTHPFSAPAHDTAAPRATSCAARSPISWRAPSAGDVIVSPGGGMLLLDLNAWPSFARVREEAAGVIAAHVAQRAERGR